MFETGDLVKNKWGELGIIIRQIGVIDRWLVQYITGIHPTGNEKGEWGDSLEYIGSSET